MRFSEVPGQDSVRKRLLQAVQQGRLAHALLFSGPEGCGHLAMALALAQYLACEKPDQKDSCGKCAACVKIRNIAHPDLHFSFPTAVVKKKKPRSREFMTEWRDAVTSNPFLGLADWYEIMGIENKQGFISVEESAAIQQALLLKAYESRYKVMIIWQAEKLRNDAANKLLKIIEEPPDHTLFLLVTERPDDLPATLLSRTQLVRFNRIPDDVIQQELMRQGADEDAARRFAGLAEGNLNQALSFIRHDDTATELEQEFMDWMRMCYTLSAPKNREAQYIKLNEWIDQVSRSGRERQKTFLRFGLEVLRDCLLYQHAGELSRLSDELLPGFSKFAPFIHAGNVERFENELSKASFNVERNANPRILFLDLSFKVNALLHARN